MNIIRRHVWVTGRVQGVCFRESTRQHAAQYGVLGWVKNLPDGRVEAVFEGSDYAVRKLLRFVNTGPDHAQVTHVKTVEEAPSAEFEEFSILRRK